MEELLAARADVEQPSERGQSPLMLASAAGHVELCQKLLKEAWMARCWPKYRCNCGTPKQCSVVVREGEPLQLLHFPIDKDCYAPAIQHSNGHPLSTGDTLYIYKLSVVHCYVRLPEDIYIYISYLFQLGV